jgi:hypothetical protein
MLPKEIFSGVFFVAETFCLLGGFAMLHFSSDSFSGPLRTGLTLANRSLDGEGRTRFISPHARWKYWAAWWLTSIAFQPAW